MPFIENQGAKLYWDEQGAGEPLLLIMGLSYPSCMWNRSRLALANGYRTVALDNRGVGQSDVPPLTISDLRIWNSGDPPKNI
jgi:3-oxoadipate enol-lactonase